MEVLRRCPLAIAQRLVHCAIALSTAVLDRVTKTMSVAPLLMNNLDNSKQKTSNLLSPAPPPYSWSLLGKSEGPAPPPSSKIFWSRLEPLSRAPIHQFIWPASGWKVTPFLWIPLLCIFKVPIPCHRRNYGRAFADAVIAQIGDSSAGRARDTTLLAVVSLVERPTEKLMRVWGPSGARDVSPGVSFQCRLSDGIYKAPVCISIGAHGKNCKHWQPYHCLATQKCCTHW